MGCGVPDVMHPPLGVAGVRVHPELETKAVDLLPEPDHAVWVPLSVDRERAVRPAEPGRVSAIQVHFVTETGSERAGAWVSGWVGGWMGRWVSARASEQVRVCARVSEWVRE